MITRQTNSRLSSEAGQAIPTSRKSHQSATNNKPGSKVKRRRRQEPTVKHYYKFYYVSRARNSAGASHPAQLSACSVYVIPKDTAAGRRAGPDNYRKYKHCSWRNGALIWLLVMNNDRQKAVKLPRQSLRHSLGSKLDGLAGLVKDQNRLV